MTKFKFLLNPYPENIAEKIFRVLFSLIFIVAGVGHLLKPDQIVSRLISAPGADLFTFLAPPKILVIAAGIALFLAGVSLALGFLNRVSAAILIGTLIPITLSVQIGSPEGLGPLFKNIALLGGLIYFTFRDSSKGEQPRALAKGRKSGLARNAIVAAAAGGCVFGAGLLIGHANADARIPTGISGVSFLVREPNHIKAAIMTAQNIVSGKEEVKASAASVVICGPKGVEAATKGHEIEKLLVQAKRQGIDVSVCGLTLKEKNIDPKTISDFVRIVENGMTEMFRLQQLGYLSVQL